MTTGNNSNNQPKSTLSQSKDAFSLYKQNTEKFFNNVRQSVPQYHQAITNIQQEYLQASESVTNSVLEFQKDTTRNSGIPTNVSDTTVRAIQDTADDMAKASSINNQIVLMNIDAAQQNIKTFNDNVKSFANLNRDIIKSWMSIFNFKLN